MDLNSYLYLNNEIKLAIVGYLLEDIDGKVDDIGWVKFKSVQERFDKLELSDRLNEHTVRRTLNYLVKSGLLIKEDGAVLRRLDNSFRASRYYAINPEHKDLKKLARHSLCAGFNLGISNFPVIGQAYYDNDKRKFNQNRVDIFSRLYKGTTQTELHDMGIGWAPIMNHLDVLLRNDWLNEPYPLKHGDSKRYHILEGKRESLDNYLIDTEFSEFTKIFNKKPFTKNNIAVVFNIDKKPAYFFVRDLNDMGFVRQENIWRKGKKFNLTKDGREVYEKHIRPILSYFNEGDDSKLNISTTLDLDKLLTNTIENYLPYMQSEKGTSRQKQFLYLIDKNTRLSQRRLSEITGLSYPSTGYFLKKLLKKSYINPMGKSKSYIYYGLTKAGRLSLNGTINI